jgi:tRNA (guanine26-N2/guanine27-N2)-dimethyltransferase
VPARADPAGDAARPIADGLLVEGSTRLFAASTAGTGRGPAPRRADAAFYNPAMAMNRDLSVRLVAAYAAARGRPIEMADVLAGTGARALRVAHESGVDVTVFASDGDPKAVAAMERGVAANRRGDRRHTRPADSHGRDAARVGGHGDGRDDARADRRSDGSDERTEGRVVVSRANAFDVLASRRFDIVDVDPFGSAAPFLDAAVRATRHDGLVCATATDTAALCGTYPRVCKRRYGAMPVHAPAWRAEAGLRILQGALIAAAGRHDRDAMPVFAVARGHWMRVVMRVRDGAGAADRRRRDLGPVAMDGATRQAVREGDGGPLHWGALHDAAAVTAMAGVDATDASPETAALVEGMASEALLPAFWLSPADAASGLRTDTPRRERVLRGLAQAGFVAGPSHMDAAGVRTDATPGAVAALWKSLF